MSDVPMDDFANIMFYAAAGAAILIGGLVVLSLGGPLVAAVLMVGGVYSVLTR